MLANGSAKIKPAKSGRFSANQLAKAITPPANAAFSKISILTSLSATTHVLPHEFCTKK